MITPIKPKAIVSVAEYIAAQPVAVRDLLERVRRAIRKAVPEAEEVISYQIPGYKLQGDALLYFAAWKGHYSLYPATGRVLAEFGDELAKYEVEQATIRFSFLQPVPLKLIERIARFRATEVAARKRGTSHSAR